MLASNPRLALTPDPPASIFQELEFTGLYHHAHLPGPCKCLLLSHLIVTKWPLCTLDTMSMFKVGPKSASHLCVSLQVPQQQTLLRCLAV